MLPLFFAIYDAFRDFSYSLFFSRYDFSPFSLAADCYAFHFFIFAAIFLSRLFIADVLPDFVFACFAASPRDFRILPLLFRRCHAMLA